MPQLARTLEEARTADVSTQYRLLVEWDARILALVQSMAQARQELTQAREAQDWERVEAVRALLQEAIAGPEGLEVE